MSKINKKCASCNKDFSAWSYQIRLGQGKCCSIQCAGQYKKGKIIVSAETRKKISEALKGRKTWSTGKKITGSMYAKMYSSCPSGDKNWNWRGDCIGYEGLHKWISEKFGKAKEYSCMFCNKQGENETIDWANLDHKYTRNLNTWTTLCRKCHMDYDKEILGVKVGRHSKPK